MTKFSLNLIGYILSFIAGSMFSVGYIDAKLEPIEKHVTQVVKEESVVTEEAALFEEVTPWEQLKDTLELNIQLPEVTIIGNKVIPTAEKGVCIQTVEKQSIISKVVYDTPIAVRKEPTNQNVETLKEIYKLTPVSLAYSIEAKARSPGLALIDNGANDNNSNFYVMLKEDKKYVRAILKLLFTGNKFFNIKDDGTIIIKKHWYSQKKITTSVKELITYTIPKVIIALSRDLAEDYQIEVVEIKDFNKAIATAFEHFSNFCVETGFQGKTLDFDLTPNKIHRKVIRTKILFSERIENLKQLNLSTLLIKIVPNSFETKEVKKLKALPSKTIKSFKEILIEQYKLADVQFRRVGLCMPGSLPVNDTGMVGVYRLVDKIDLV